VGLDHKTAANGNLSTIGVPTKLFAYTELTCYVRGYQYVIPSTGAGNSCFISILFGNGALTPFVIGGIFNNSTDNRYDAFWCSGSTFKSMGATRPAATVGPLSYGATFKVNGNVIQYVNGVAIANATAFGVTGPTHSAPDLVQYGKSGQPTGSVDYLYLVWDRVLTAQEMLDLHVSPFRFLVPQQGEMGVRQGIDILMGQAYF
jgi:hypothetical protein